MQYPKATKYLSGFCYDNALQYKGFLLQAATRLKTLAQSDTTASKLYDNLKSYRYLLSKEYAKPIAERQHVEEWEEKANTLEKELTRTVAGFGEALRQVTWQEVQQQLQPGETAIEFVHYQYHNPEPTDSVFYSALVLRPGDEAPHFVTLFEEREIAPLLAKASGKKSSRIDDFYLNGDGANGEKLYQLIWQPLRELLGGTKKVYVSPSGLLHRINLGAVPFPLQGNKGQTFADSYQLTIVGSTRQLIVKDPAAAPNANAVVFGGIRYQTDTTAMIASNETVSRSNDLPDILKFQSDTTSRGGNLDYLPNSLTEALSIKGKLESANFTVQLDTGYYANEEAFKQIGKYGASPRILHVATHGYFYPDPEEMVDGRRQTLDGGEQVFRNSRHPMIRSGLIMAGAEDAYFNGKSPADREDGVLTAYEISQMNLANTELVVLSACETGLGDIQGNEGVYGLQRAFKIAGAKNLIMSLWQVNDLSTNAFMTEFYRQWLRQGLEIPAAFRAAQGIVREQYPDSPYLWAGFVLVE
ncbi:MAG: CHAT domain-containing protein [Saprospiraceae bacterium]